ncbi:peptide deformylase [Alloacidobacterium sp.]|uniref:peptide deformylase n=1 Tax=Alloacidobacterium sp. TaxID=2951999 RepID=UPI002D2F3C60|nr:peptide deformylase [Alloacidobacterium sp.]HYK35986.1 peptide deformylase [Alloacidobacterium sp.]
MLLKIVNVGDPILRRKARALDPDEIRSARIQDLIAWMRDTMHDAPGVGLAAPQVGESLQFAVIEDRAEYHKNVSEADLKERERKPVEFHVIINPQIELLAPPDVAFHEGCLSLPGFMAVVPRARKVRVICLDERGKPRTIEASGWYARILQHEIDHLDGRIYIDRMRSESFSTLENYQKSQKK